MNGGGGGGRGGRVEVVNSKGCSRLFLGLSSPLSSFRGLQPLEPMSPASSSAASELVPVRSSGPFAGLVICVTGLSKGIKFSDLHIVNFFSCFFSNLNSAHMLICFFLPVFMRVFGILIRFASPRFLGDAPSAFLFPKILIFCCFLFDFFCQYEGLVF